MGTKDSKKINHKIDKNISIALNKLKKGIFHKENRMEEVFHEKFIKLRLKIHKIIEGQYDDELMYEILVHSILIDCRAIFLENTDYKYNTTLQNIYRNRSLNEYADGIDNYFNTIIKGNKSLKEIIRKFVNKRLAHVDYLEEKQENILEEDILTILDRNTINNIFVDILVIAIQYEEIRKYFGKNKGEQLDRIFETLTSTKQN